MYNAKFVIPGIIVFAGLFTAPFWINMLSSDHEAVKVELPTEPVKFFGEERTQCIEPREWMAANHMELLLEWRDQALREGKRIYVASDGKKWETSLQNTCMACHSNKAEFCDKCHNANSVNPYCWDCHVVPQGNNHEFE
ncbi:sulfate reduction electron transfer complex DsrMKJOP subunit DsrJ [uncultured Mailhella sp.]|uniref:sulfate reduction electron transfer complex DsrMKJOP subunit DsrJ n=1 Tax=uncultured Mailhella sp. TaxID=1981031 RepID=UPI0025F2A944|nr:sulfate reduction electron transfer complex DsrMKJOP subunit DsrJ [uncultured Mailhella sp.]